LSDHLEVIGPTGEVLFYELVAGQGVTSIGRAASNDLRLQSPTVADYAATLDHRQTPFTLMALTDGGAVRVNGRALRTNEFLDLQPWDSIELDGYVLIVAPGDNGAGNASISAAGIANGEDGSAYAPYDTQTHSPTSSDGAAGTIPPSTTAPIAGQPQPIQPVANGGAAASTSPAASATPPSAATAAAVSTAASVAATAAPGAATVAGESVVATPPAAALVNTSLPQLGPPLPPRTDPLIYAVLNERQQTVDVQTPAQWQFTMTNVSTLVSRFQLRVEGWIDSAWFVFDDNEFTLIERENRVVTLTAIPPRTPASVAGPHHFVIVISSDNLPGHEVRIPATLTINPYYEYGVEPLQPLSQTIGWRKRNARFVLPVQNRGNAPAHYRIEATDRENATRIEFVEESRLHLGMREMAIPAATEVELPILVTPLKRRLIGAGPRTYDMTVTVTPLEGALGQFPTRGELKHKPLFGRWVLLLLALLIATAILLLFRPRVTAVRLTYVNQAGELETRLSNTDQFAQSSGLINTLRARAGLAEAAEEGELSALMADGSLTDATVRAGQPLTVTWETRNGGSVSLGFLGNQETSLVTVDTPASVRRGSFGFVPAPNIGSDNESDGPTLYELRLDNWMQRVPLISALGQVSRPLVVQVIPANAPIIEAFVVSTDTTVLGNPVSVSWNATMPNAGDQLMLEQRQGEQLISSTVLTTSNGTMAFEPLANTEFRLVPSTNVWIGASQPTAATRNVNVLVPTPTPVPTPDIRGFMIEPNEVVAGNPITITYAISGASVSSLRFFGLPTPQIDLEFDSGRVSVPVPSPGPFNVAIVAVRLPDGSTDPEDPAAARVTAVASRVAVMPTPSPTPTFTLTPTPTPQIPVIEVLNLSPAEITRGATEEVLLTWNVIGDMDQIVITAPDYSITSLEKQSSLSVPRDQTRVFVLSVTLDGETAASKSVELKVNEPTPTPEPTPTATPEPPPPTATATPTLVPNPAIVSFGVMRTDGEPVTKEVDDDGNDIFFVPGGSEVSVSWEVQNATTVQLRELTSSGFDRLLTNRLAKDQIVLNALEDISYIMTAYNNPADVDVTNPENVGKYGSVERRMSLELEAAQQFDPPTNVQWSRGGDGIDNENDPVIVTWEYNPQQTNDILGFRIYKAAAGSSSFVRLVDESTLTNTSRSHTDEQKPLCDQAYFIVAVFQDLTKPGADKTVETDAGADSFITPPCP